MLFGRKIKSAIIKDGVYKYNDVYLKYIQVIRTFRECIPLLDDVDHVENTGVYILLGVNDSGRTVVYVGKSENVLKRINTHKKDSDKDFFTELFLITTNDNSFGDSHVSYIENLIYNRFRISANLIVHNDVIPGKGNLSEDEAEDCENFGDTIINIISQAASGRILITQFGKPESSIFTLRNQRSCEITATLSEGKLIFHKDSKVSRDTPSKTAHYIKSVRDELIENGSFIEYRDRMILSRDITLDGKSISQATNILVGANVTDCESLWKNYSGMTLKEYKEHGIIP